MTEPKTFQNPIAPHDRLCMPIRVIAVNGAVERADALTGPGGTTVLTYPADGEQPRVLLDLGPASPGGYPVLRIRAHSGTPVLRLSYADWLDFITDERFAPIGDHRRGCCKYLGTELPVLPADPDRFERYTICRDGLFTHPLIQGQQRFVRLALDTPGTQVEIESFAIWHTGDLSPMTGTFQSSCPALDHLWAASVYTVMIASIDGAASWDNAVGPLCLRALTQADPAGIYTPGTAWTDYTFAFTAEIVENPHAPSGIGWLVRADGHGNGVLLRLDLDGSLRRYIRRGGAAREISPRIRLGEHILPNRLIRIETTVCGDEVRVAVDGRPAAALSCAGLPCGTVGFCQTTETWALCHGLRVTAPDGTVLLDDDLRGVLDDYAFARSPAFLADGAKRDRLPWLGDLDWAGRNAYYAFGPSRYMAETLRMFARHQTPEGYIFGVCYPEDERRPLSGEHGYYQSDIFSAWFVPTLQDYLLFTADRSLGEELYPAAAADLDYLWDYVTADGLFYQRYATSKGLWDHALNDIGFFSYVNILLVDALEKGAWIAAWLGRADDAAEYRRRADLMRTGLFSRLYRADVGGFIKGTEDPTLCYMSTALALATGLLTGEKAHRAVDACLRAQEDGFFNGKVVSLFIRGCFRCGRAADAWRILTGSTGKTEFLGTCTVNWIDAVADEKGPACTAESMAYGHERIANGEAWGDLSHPDTAVAHLITGGLLGVQPIGAGFSRFAVAPAPCGLTHADAVVPTPHGQIRVAFSLENGVLSLTVEHPSGTEPVIALPDGLRERTKVTCRLTDARSERAHG